MTKAELEEKEKAAEERKSVKKVSLEKDDDELEEAKKEAEITQITKKHYRTFYNDELENEKQDLFKRMPFYSFDIWRGQSRGAKKSSWFGSSNEDESGQTSTLTKAGYFKGSIDITNLEEHKQFTKEQEEAIGRIIDLLKKIHQKKLGQPFDFDMEMLESLETKNVFANVLENIDCDWEGLVEFLTEM